MNSWPSTLASRVPGQLPDGSFAVGKHQKNKPDPGDPPSEPSGLPDGTTAPSENAWDRRSSIG